MAQIPTTASLSTNAQFHGWLRRQASRKDAALRAIRVVGLPLIWDGLTSLESTVKRQKNPYREIGSKDV